MGCTVFADHDRFLFGVAVVDVVEFFDGVVVFGVEAGVLVVVGNAVDVDAHPIDIFIARVIIGDRGSWGGVGAPDHGDVGCVLPHFFGDEAEFFDVLFGVAVVFHPGAIHFASEAEEDGGFGCTEFLGEGVEIFVVFNVFKAVIWFEGDVDNFAFLPEFGNPIGGDGATVAHVVEVGGVLLADYAFERPGEAADFAGFVFEGFEDGVVEVDKCACVTADTGFEFGVGEVGFGFGVGGVAVGVEGESIGALGLGENREDEYAEGKYFLEELTAHRFGFIPS